MPNDDYIKRIDAKRALIALPADLDSEVVQRCIEAMNKPKAADVEPKRKWISVTEGLPEDDTIVLVVSQLYHNPYPAFQIGGVWYDGYRVACQAENDMDDEWTIDDSGITYWTPLPEPPKEEEDGV